MAKPRRPWTYYADKHGIPRKLAAALMGIENAAQSDTATSPKGAVGRLQIHLPSHPGITRAQAEDPDFNYNWGFRYLAQQKKAFGSWRLALAAYNAGPGAVEEYGGVPPYAETQKYVRNILRRAGVLTPVKTSAPRGRAGATASLAPPPMPGPDLDSLATEGLQSVIQGSYSPQAGLQALLDARESTPIEKESAAAPRSMTPEPQRQQGPADPNKWVRIPKPQGQWAPPGPEVVGFVAGLAQAYGKPLDVWDTTTHSRMTVNGRVSAHTDARALDIPAKGHKLRRLGYLALRRAGMPEKEARRAMRKGGLFNVGRYQIIFATQIGGDHTDHVHVGVRG